MADASLDGMRVSHRSRLQVGGFDAQAVMEGQAGDVLESEGIRTGNNEDRQ